MKHKGEFKGQRTFVIPDYIIQDIKKEPLSESLYITDIGYFPDAIDHYRTRAKGCNQNILIYCLNGSGWISVDGKKHSVKANQYFIIPANKPHSYGSNSNEPWSIYWVHYAGTLSAYFSDNINAVKNITPSSIDRIDDRLHLFEEILKNLEMGYSLDNINYANICLKHFLASFCFLTQFRQIRKTMEEDMIEKSINYMKNNVQKKLSLEDLAHESGWSASHYSLEFRKKIGHSPMDYLIQLKIQKACQILDHTALRIKEVAQQIGYDDAYYFSRLFKKTMNLSPKAYRSNLKG